MDRPIVVPHAWRQDVPVSWEGPATYRTTLEPPDTNHLKPNTRRWLLFHGVSYACVVRIDDAEAGRHEGIWDAFSIPVFTSDTQHPVLLEVEVIKNGGPTYPVRDVASGFLPYVFHTFGGIYKPVELVWSEADPLEDLPPASPSRVAVKGSKIYLAESDSKLQALTPIQAPIANRRPSIPKLQTPSSPPSTIRAPFLLRAPLTWGWYPDIGHPNPPEETVRREVRQAKALGFNTIKFCLWAPAHRYLEIMREEGMEAWLELPVWDPSPDPDGQAEMFAEMQRVVRQYRRHDNIIVWTCGCELSESTSADFRRSLIEMVERETGCPLVKDSSGGAEMYGGDLREFGDFYDFHPYCDTQFYPLVLDSLLPGPRRSKPTLIGEFDDIDVHRDLHRLAKDKPYWASEDPADNGQGVRWRHDLPAILLSDWSNGSDRSARLGESSRKKALFMRKYVQEAVRARSEIGGYVVTGWRDTPISSSGFIDDWGEPRFSPQDLAWWNGATCLFLIPGRRPPWVNGGNRPGWIDPYNHFVGQILWRVGIHSERPIVARGSWSVVSKDLPVAEGRFEECRVDPLESTEIGEISWDCERPGDYELRVHLDKCENRWPIWAVPKRDHVDQPALVARDLAQADDQAQMLLLLDHDATIPMPFWREAAYEFIDRDGFWAAVPFADRWERLLAVSPDRAIDLDALVDILHLESIEILMNRIDTRTYREDPMIVRALKGGKPILATTLRPDGGLGVQPLPGRNPAGSELLWGLLRFLQKERGDP